MQRAERQRAGLAHLSGPPIVLDAMQGLQPSAVFQRLPQARWARPALGALGLLLAGTLLLSHRARRAPLQLPQVQAPAHCGPQQGTLIAFQFCALSMNRKAGRLLRCGLLASYMRLFLYVAVRTAHWQ